MHQIIYILLAVFVVWSIGKWRSNRHVVRASRTNAYGLMSQARFPMSPRWGSRKRGL